MIIQNPFNHDAIKLVSLAGMTEHTKTLFGADYKTKFAIYIARSIFSKFNYTNGYPSSEVAADIGVVASRLASDINEIAYFDGETFINACREFHNIRVKLCIGVATPEEYMALYSPAHMEFENMTDEHRLFLAQLSTNAISMVPGNDPWSFSCCLKRD